MKSTRVLALFVLLTLSVMGTAQSGFAQTPTMFLAITDLDGNLVVMGDAPAGSPHPNTIVVLSWSWGASTALKGQKPVCNIQDVSVVKFADTASPALLMAQLGGTIYEKATLFVRSPTSVDDDIVMEFFGVRLSSMSIGGSGGQSNYTENVSFKFSSAKYTDGPSGESAEVGGC